MSGFVDRFPTLDAVGAAGVRQAFALLDTFLVGVIRQQDVADRQIGGVQVVDVCWENASRAPESRSSRPIANTRQPACRRRYRMAVKCRTRRASVGWSRCAGNSRPGYRRPGTIHSAGRRPRSRIRNRGRRCGGNIFVNRNGDISAAPRHQVRSCLAPIRRNSPGWRSWSMLASLNVTSNNSSSERDGHFGSGNAS